MEPALKFEFLNQTEKDITLIIEPWAVEFDIAPSSLISIKVLFEKLGSIETELNSKYYIVWLWGNCRAEVLLDGEDRTPPSLSIPAFG